MLSSVLSSPLTSCQLHGPTHAGRVCVFGCKNAFQKINLTLIYLMQVFMQGPNFMGTNCPDRYMYLCALI